MYIIDYNCIQHTYVETLNLYLFFEKRCMHKHKTFTTSRSLILTIQDNIAADSDVKNLQNILNTNILDNHMNNKN